MFVASNLLSISLDRKYLKIVDTPEEFLPLDVRLFSHQFLLNSQQICVESIISVLVSAWGALLYAGRFRPIRTTANIALK